MTAFLFTWNPNKWRWPDISGDQQRLREQGFVVLRWSCGNTKRIRCGDRAFLIRLGPEPRGIVGSGVVVQERYEAPHYNPEHAHRNKTAEYVDIRFDILHNPERDDILPYQQLTEDKILASQNWSPYASGTGIHDAVVAQLEHTWAEITAGEEPSPLPEEVNDPAPLFEGASRHIWVNSYERDPEGRRLCIAHYGAHCSICGFDFGAAYGTVGIGLIHVHHLHPLAEIGGEYAVDPINDLRPVCPNCHAIIHRRKPPYTLEEVHGFLIQDESRG